MASLGRSPGVTTDRPESTEQRLGPRRLFDLTRPALRLVWRSSPRETINVLVLQTLSGLTLPAQLLAGKWVLDAVLKASREGAR